MGGGSYVSRTPKLRPAGFARTYRDAAFFGRRPLPPPGGSCVRRVSVCIAGRHAVTKTLLNRYVSIAKQPNCEKIAVLEQPKMHSEGMIIQIMTVDIRA
jgi:hypothetical protein